METNAMDKNVLKKYAVWARRELIVRVGQRATFYGVTAEDYGDVSAESINGRILSDIEKKQRKALIAQIRKKGYEEVIEEVAYTWFNRFLALRFMEVNGYLPDRVKIFTDCDNRFQPQILNEAIDLEIDGLDMEKVYAYKDANQTEELYKYLLVVQCNALNAVLPGMFQKIEDYTELLLPDKLLLEGSVIERMIALIPEEDWKDAVQIIGWMYQYYNSEKKDEVFATLKKNVKITKENIPAATQLFTPDWIVRYMVENSLGRLWLEGHPNEELKADWIYYLEEAEQEPEVEAELVKIRAEYAQLTPEDIRCIDPCQGSGHILVYMFDVLMQIYESYGYTTQEAVASIVKNNIYGLDIDERAAQLSYFAVMMKACQYDKRFLKRKDEDGKPKVPQPRVYAIQESNDVDSHVLEYFCNGNAELKEVMGTIMEEMHDAKEYGSIITVTEQNWNVIYARFEEIKEDISIHKEGALELLPLVQVAQSLAQKYDVVVTNPPYMGGSGMSNILSTFVKRKFPNTKSDMSTIMMEHILDMCSKFGYMSMINIPVWMFLSSYEKMRNNILRNNMIINMVHPGRGIFGSDFGTTSFVISKQRIKKYIGRYYRLFDSQGEVHSIEERRRAFLDGRGLHLVQQDNFEKIPGMPIAYWLQRQIYEMYGSYKTMAEIAEPKVGMQTSNNDKYLRFWHEIRFDEFRGSSFGLKWIKYLKGGAYRKWYGNLEYLLFYNKTPDYILSQKNARVLDLEFLKKKKCTWTDLTISKNSFRIAPDDTFYDISGHCFFPKEKDQLWLLGYVNTSIFAELLKVFNSTIHCQVGDVGKIIVPNIESQKKKVSDLAEQNVNFSKVDWDSFETSWDFVGHPLTQGIIEDGLIMDKYKDWKTECDTRFNQLKANEEELNRIFIDIYGLQNEFSPEVDDKDVTIRKADLQRDIKSLISYAVGCMFGRYSIYKQGLIYAGGNFNEVYGDFPIEVININPNIAAHGTALYKYGAPIDTYEKVYLKDI